MISTAKEVKVLATALSLVFAIGLLATPAMAQAAPDVHLSVNGEAQSVDVVAGDELSIAARNRNASPATVITFVSVAQEPEGLDLANAVILHMRDLAPGGTDTVVFALPAGLPTATYAVQSFAFDSNGLILRSSVVRVTIAP